MAPVRNPIGLNRRSSAASSNSSRSLVERRLAACVNILAGARSIYRWKEKIEDAPEFMLVIKSRRDLFGTLCAEIEKLHSYESPEVIALQIVDGSENYLGWLDRELGS